MKNTTANLMEVINVRDGIKSVETFPQFESSFRRFSIIKYLVKYSAFLKVLGKHGSICYLAILNFKGIIKASECRYLHNIT